jgi:hypothetical protein
MPEKKASKAAKPPAEVPIPTIGKVGGLGLEEAVSSAVTPLEEFLVKVQGI